MQEQATRRAGEIETNETDRLIASDKVEGTAVYNRKGEQLGKIHNFMVDKYSGQVIYAVMSFGGFLGVGNSYHALPWNVLTYDRDGYVVDLDRSLLERAPRYTTSEVPNWSDHSYRHSIEDYYAPGGRADHDFDRSAAGDKPGSIL